MQQTRKVLLLRHGMTYGNKEKRFIGVTDDLLCEEGKEELSKLREVYIKQYPTFFTETDLVYVSPMLRCIDTANILFSDHEKVIVEELRECDFGILENKNHQELMDNEAYRDFIEADKNEAFPGGESIEGFLDRCADAFRAIMLRNRDKNIPIILVVHGGTIMGIMDRFYALEEKKPYYSWSPDNGCGYLCDLSIDKNELKIINACQVGYC